MQKQLKEQTRSDPDLLAWVYQIQALHARAKHVENKLPKKLFDPQFGTPEKYVFATVYLKQVYRLFSLAQDDLILLKSSYQEGGGDCGALTTGFAKRAQNLSGVCVEIVGDGYQNREMLALIQVKFELDTELAKLVAEHAKESIETFLQVLGSSVDTVLSAAKGDFAHLINLIESFVVEIERSVA